MAAADSPDSYGLGSRIKALGGAGTALAGDPQAVYYNPAGLIGLSRAAIGLEYSYSCLDLHLKRTGPNDLLDAADRELDSGPGDRYGIESAAPSLQSARDVPDDQALNLVLAAPLSRRLSFGLAASVPGRRILKQKYGPVESPYFLDYSVAGRRLALDLGAGIAITSFLRFGLGTSIIAATAGEALAHVPLDDPNKYALFSTDYDFRTIATPTGGALLSIGDRLDLGFSYRGELSVTMDSYQVMITNVNVGPFRLDLPLPVRLRATTDFSPRRLAVGAAWRPGDRFLLTGDLVQVAWSRYKPPFPEIEVDFSATDKIALPLKHPQIPLAPAAGFRDILVPRLGAEARIGHGMAVRIGSFHRPSPAPPQTGPTNIIAPDLLGFTAGFGWTVNPFGLFPGPVELDFHLQVIDQKRRGHEKDESLFEDEKPKLEGLQSSNPGYPGIEYEGRVLSAGIALVLPL